MASAKKRIGCGRGPGSGWREGKASEHEMGRGRIGSSESARERKNQDEMKRKDRSRLFVFDDVAKLEMQRAKNRRV
jgi:hypothetical protein